MVRKLHKIILFSLSSMKYTFTCFSCYRCGKRKRSCRERSIDCEMRVSKPTRNGKPKNRDKMQGEDTVDCSRISSSSISSSDSEAGLITNDEDREGK